ncbi:hypothetical protein BDW68DRAFT_169287 [Aspergillus falconensis]
MLLTLNSSSGCPWAKSLFRLHGSLAYRDHYHLGQKETGRLSDSGCLSCFKLCWVGSRPETALLSLGSVGLVETEVVRLRIPNH